MSRDVVHDILRAWQGPNKNELVTFISLEGDKVLWCEVHSWMDDTTLHGMIRDRMILAPFTIENYGFFIMEYVPKHWARKEFEDFEYLEVTLHWGWTLAAFILVMAISFGCYFFIDNSR